MSQILNLIFLLLNFYSSISNNQLINNPVIKQNALNIVNYTFIIQYKSDQNSLAIKQNLEKILYESYIFGSNFFICTDPSNNNYLLIDKKYFNITNQLEKYSFSNKKELFSDYVYIGHLTRKFNDYNRVVEQVILYGIENNNKLCFINTILSNNIKCIQISNYDGYAYCKNIENWLTICAYSINNKLNLIFFILPFDKGEPNIIRTKNCPEIEIEDIIVLYDTSDSKVKILCARMKQNLGIECFKIDISYQIGNRGSILMNEPNIEKLEKDKYNITFSYNENCCNYTIFNSEYLLCCGKTDQIYCERRDMDFKYIADFKINSRGKNTNLTIQRTDDDEGVTLYYTNTSSEEKYIYEYYIYPPKSNKTFLELSHYQSKSLNLDNLFERKTNTNYYITFNNILTNYGDIYLNNELINEENIKKPILISGNNLTFISNNYESGNNLEIKYNISIEETYSSESSLNIAIKSCYNSCKSCTGEKSNNTHHYCLSCKEEKDYYPYSYSESVIIRRKWILNRFHIISIKNLKYLLIVLRNVKLVTEH